MGTRSYAGRKNREFHGQLHQLGRGVYEIECDEIYRKDQISGTDITIVPHITAGRQCGISPNRASEYNMKAAVEDRCYIYVCELGENQ